MSPAVRKLAKEHRLDVSQIRGSGMGGRVTRDDVLEALASESAAPEAPPIAPEAPAQPAPVRQDGKREELVKLSVMRRSIAEHMVRSLATSPHAWTLQEIDVTNLVPTRRRCSTGRGDATRWSRWGRLKEGEERLRLNLTYMPFIMKAVVRALRVPGSQRLHDRHRGPLQGTTTSASRFIGTKGSSFRGCDADRKTLLQIAQEIDDIGARARGDSSLNDIQGGTFPVERRHVQRDGSTPVISYPESAILGVHLIQEQAVVPTA
jgi:2-oxoisovalerate dehydrogenase E2 component (dihydrolipoyl transacylase)